LITKIIGYGLLSLAISFLGFSIYRATDTIVPELQTMNTEIKMIRQEIQQLKGNIPGLTQMGTLQQTTNEGQKVMERAMKTDPRKHIDPFGIFN
jgi:hypothetical protein